MNKERKKIIYIASNVGMEYFFFLKKILVYSGFDVKEIFLLDESNYRFLSRNNLINKIWLRVCTYLYYPLSLIINGLFADKKSVFIISSNTFYAPFLTQFILGFKRHRIIHLLYDLYPDALETNSIIRRDSLISLILGRIIINTQKFCAGTVYLGTFLKRHAEYRWGKPQKSAVIDISTDLSLYQERRTSINDVDKIIIHYGGQLGIAHDVIAIISCVKEVYNSELSRFIDFSFYVQGSKVDYLRKQLQEYPVKINDTIKSHEWRKKTKDFHIGLVTLAPNAATVCLPSKTYGLMASGLAILSISPAWSDLSNLIINNNAGWNINNSTLDNLPSFSNKEKYFKGISKYRQMDLIVHDFVNIMKEIIENKEILRTKMTNSAKGVRQKHNINSLSKKWGEFLFNFY